MNLDSLFEAARQDGPSEERKKATWNEIATATGAATVAVAAKSSVGAKALALKIFLVSAFVVSVSGAATRATDAALSNPSDPSATASASTGSSAIDRPTSNNAAVRAGTFEAPEAAPRIGDVAEAVEAAKERWGC